MSGILERGGRSLCATLLALTACGAPPSVLREASLPASSAATTSVPATVVATPPPPPPVPPLPRDVRKVETLARCDTELQVFPVGRAWFGICGGGFNRGSAFVIDEAGKLRDEPKILAGLPADATVRVAGGPSIDALELAYDTPGIRGENRNWKRRRGRAWVDLPHRQVPGSFIEPKFKLPWSLELDGYELGASWDGSIWFSDRSALARWVPKPAAGTGEDCPRRIRAYLGMAHAEGAVWGVGTTCDGALAAERFEVGKPGSSIETILRAGAHSASDSGYDGGGVLASRDGVLVWADAPHERQPSGQYVAKHPPTVVLREAGRWKKLDTSDLDGKSVHQGIVAGKGQALLVLGDSLARVGTDGVEPFLTGVESVVVAPDRSAWAFGKRDVYRWIDGRVEQVVLEGDADGREIVDLQFDAGGRALVVARTAGQEASVLLREVAKDTKATTNPLELAGERPFTSPFSNFFQLARVPSSVHCSTALVLLYRLAKTAPADYDFPATRAALKGQRQFEGASFVELEAVGERHFVAVVHNDAELAFALARKVETSVKGSKPLVFCEYAFPSTLPIRRTLDIDLATGELRRPAAKP